MGQIFHGKCKPLASSFNVLAGAVLTRPFEPSVKPGPQVSCWIALAH